MERKFKQNATQLSCLCNASGSAVLLTDPKRMIQYINTEQLFKADKICSQDLNINWQRYNDTKCSSAAVASTASDDELFQALKQAVADKKLYLTAQPIFDFDNNEVIIVEILLRWTHIYYGAINPLKIIELAEKNDYLFNIATYVTETLIEFLQLNSYHDKHICFAMNLSLPQIIDSNLIQHLLTLIDNSGLNRSKFIFESTGIDSLSIPLNKATIHFNQIRCQGIKIATGDFGAGYSTLDYISNPCIDFLKMDRSLVTGIESSPRKLDTLLSLIKLCKRIGVTTIIEGIENEHQHQLLVNSGIQGILVQGFLYARPSPLHLNQFCHNSFIEHYSSIAL